ncbi:hypothetical protein ACP4OV_011037 [Aristida adscensionis]
MERSMAAEPFCFMCKDGGDDLRRCDFENCLKSYHPHCVGLEDDVPSSDGQFICDCHFCVDCKESSDYQCLCCPIHSVCRDCIVKVEFIQVRKEGKGFCRSCLNLALAISMEKSGDADPYWAKIASQYKVNYKSLFGDYWEVISKRESLALVDLQEANTLFNRGFNHKRGADSEKFPAENVNIDENLLGGSDNREKTFTFDSKGIPYEVNTSLKERTGSGKFPSEDQKAGENLFDHSEQIFPSDSEGKANKGNTSTKKRKYKRRTYIGWGSKELIEFLSSFGKDTTQPLDESAIVCVVKEYVSEKNLFQDRTNKIFNCDDKLRSLFRKRKVKCNAIHRLVETHLAANAISEDESLDDSEDDDQPIKKKKPQNSLELRIAKSVAERNRSCFASLVPNNLKLIYLRKSLIISLLSHPDTFEQKVVGCLVRIKNPPRTHTYQVLKKPFQVGLVTSIKKSSEEYKITKDTCTNIILRVPGFYDDVKISILADGDFEEEECNDLIPLVERGVMKRPTVAELENKVAIVHEDIVNHVGLIEKSCCWKEGLIKHMKKGGAVNILSKLTQISVGSLDLLSTQAERQRRLDEVPEIIAYTEDVKDETELKVAGGKSSQENRDKRCHRASCLVDMEESCKEVTQQVADSFDVLKEELRKGATEHVAEPLKNSISVSAKSAGTNLYKQTIATQVANNNSRETPEILEEKPSDSSPEATQQVAEPPYVFKEGQLKGAMEHVAEPFKILEEKPSEECTLWFDHSSMFENKSPVQEKVETSNIFNKEPSKDGSMTQAMDIDKDESSHSWCNRSEHKEAMYIDNKEIINLDSDEDEDLNTEHQDPEGEAMQQAPGAMNGGDLHMKRPKPASGVTLNDLGATSEVQQEQHKQAYALQQKQVWHYADPEGVVRGPFSLKKLLSWYKDGYFYEDFKVWRTGQKPDQAISLKELQMLSG